MAKKKLERKDGFINFVNYVKEYVIWYCSNHFKIEYRKRHDIEMEFVDITQPITKSYDLILHKVNDEIPKEHKDENIKRSLTNLEVRSVTNHFLIHRTTSSPILNVQISTQ